MQRTQDLVRSSSRTQVKDHGWYAQASWFVTGEAAGFGRVKPARPFDPGGKRPGSGAWQLAARVGQLAAEEDVRSFITGSRAATQYVAGLNWYPNQMLRVSLNYEHVAFADTVAKTTSEDAILFRVQLEF
jgi:phosphate-selective porin OprO/OprP